MISYPLKSNRARGGRATTFKHESCSKHPLLYIKKNYLVLEVSCQSETVSIKPFVYFSGYEEMAHSTARSEERLCLEQVKSIYSAIGYEELKTYFEGRGWEVVEFRRI